MPGSMSISKARPLMIPERPAGSSSSRHCPSKPRAMVNADRQSPSANALEALGLAGRESQRRGRLRVDGRCAQLELIAPRGDPPAATLVVEGREQARIDRDRDGLGLAR